MGLKKKRKERNRLSGGVLVEQGMRVNRQGAGVCRSTNQTC